MRITINTNDKLGKDIQAAAQSEGVSVSSWISEIVANHLELFKKKKSAYILNKKLKQSNSFDGTTALQALLNFRRAYESRF